MNVRRTQWLWTVLMLSLGVGIGTTIYLGLKKNVNAQLASASVLEEISESTEQPVVAIPITGPLADRDAEISGLAWYEDWLIMLPQYPGRLNDQIFALAKSDILAFLQGETSAPLAPEPIALTSPDFANEIEGFEGFEAIAFRGQRAFLTIEAEAGGSATGYVVASVLADDLSELVVDPLSIAESSAQSSSPNKADEAIVLTQEAVISIYEVHGVAVNPTPQAHRFDFELNALPAIAFPNVEYRLTDATALDERDRFWAINYFYTGDRDLLPLRDPLTIRYGRGPTHRQQRTVERLVEFEYRSEGIRLTNTAPIQLELAKSGRNWEGIARLEDQGFLLVTDKFPDTILGFVALPE
ncbi:MAG: hypothetical protein AAFZ17_03885 [Cyanobacteria bacterium J06650_10]